MKTKTLNKIRWINTGPLMAHLGVTHSEKAFTTKLKAMGFKEIPSFILEGCGATTHFMTRPDGHNSVVIVALPTLKLSFSELVGLIVHESSHVFDLIMEDLGEDRPGDEIKAYSIQFISQRILEAVTG